MNLFTTASFKVYLAAAAYVCSSAYLLINPVVANHDKIMTFGLLNLGLLFFMHMKEVMAKEQTQGKPNESKDHKSY